MGIPYDWPVEKGVQGKYVVGVFTNGAVKVRFKRENGMLIVVVCVMEELRRNVKER